MSGIAAFRRIPLSIAATAIVLGVLPACGRLVAQPYDSASRSPQPGVGTEQQVDWSNPISGDLVPDLQTARIRLAFDPYPPKNLGSPSSILVSRLSRPLPDRLVAMIFDGSPYGKVVVQELTAGKSARQFDADEEQGIASINSDPYQRGSASVVTIRNGVEGFLTLSPDGLALVYWADLASGLEFVVRGPTLTKDQALAVANGL